MNTPLIILTIFLNVYLFYACEFLTNMSPFVEYQLKNLPSKVSLLCLLTKINSELIVLIILCTISIPIVLNFITNYLEMVHYYLCFLGVRSSFSGQLLSYLPLHNQKPQGRNQLGSIEMGTCSAE